MDRGLFYDAACVVTLDDVVAPDYDINNTEFSFKCLMGTIVCIIYFYWCKSFAQFSTNLPDFAWERQELCRATVY